MIIRTLIFIFNSTFTVHHFLSVNKYNVFNKAYASFSTSLSMVFTSITIFTIKSWFSEPWPFIPVFLFLIFILMNSLFIKKKCNYLAGVASKRKLDWVSIVSLSSSNTFFPCFLTVDKKLSIRA